MPPLKPWILLGLWLLGAGHSGSHAAAPATNLADILEQELKRNFEVLKAKADPAPYFISYSVTEVESDSVSATLGAVQNVAHSERRYFDCSVRVGSPALDNYRVVDGDRPRFTGGAGIPIEDKPGAIQRLAWRETDRAWRAASQRLLKLQTSTQMKANQQDTSGDFSVETPSTASLNVDRFKFSAPEWSVRLRKLSTAFVDVGRVLSSSVAVSAQREVKTFVNTEGTRLQHGRTYARLMMVARAKAADGQDLALSDSFEAADPSKLPKDDVLMAAATRLAEQMVKLLRATDADPYVGPAILSGRAAGVFFHEIFGHRVEGHRQKDESEGQTFAKSVNTAVLPPFLSVTFDPTLKQSGATGLFGWYDYDDEGVKARRVPLVENGVLKTFLMSRTPLSNIPVSNGHGRREPGMEVVARQSNLLVDSSRQLADAELRKLLIEEVVKQKKPYGLLIDQVTGGYTTTGRRGLQAFTVIPLVVYRVFPDGKPDELVRGADIVGTPLASFAKILATGNRPEVFNGFCGAESGSVPVSAVSPALLVSEIEIQRKPNPGDRPPLLTRPSTGGAE